MSTKMLFALGLGGLSAVVSMAFLAGWPGGLLVVYLAPLPLLLAGLGGGAAAATVAGATGIMTAGLIGGAHGSRGLRPGSRLAGMDGYPSRPAATLGPRRNPDVVSRRP